MKLENVDKQKVKEICHNLSSKLLTHPIFMYYCPQKSVRRDFINSYFTYYINDWSKNGVMLINESNTAMITLVDPTKYNYKFVGKGAAAMKQYKLSPNVFEHQNEVEEIFDVVVPENKKGMVMTVYASINTEFNDVQKLMKEAMEIAKQDDFILLYDTFSLRLQPLARTFGFKLVYNKNFLDTNFMHSVMIYNF